MTSPNERLLYPLLLEPMLHEKVWGGRRLAPVVNKTLKPNATVGESWEVCEESRVTNGAHRGQSVRELLARNASALLGNGASDEPFPLLFKFIDAQQDLSVQVHPDDALAQQLEGEPYGKTEAWYILHAEPNARLIHGFKRDVDEATVREQLARGTIEELLAYVPVQRGDVVFVPAGTVHAIGSGIVLAEIQQHSDTTYRLYDWNRKDDAGKARELHIDKALQAAELHALHMHKIAPLVLRAANADRWLLVACRPFVLERMDVRTRADLTMPVKFQIVSLIEGAAQIAHRGLVVTVEQGQTLLLPAQSDEVSV
ncbi:MAG: class I mannose-6-phosphate isomerase, partial [Chloroflexi bacterium]|nr:class I mannose-6-phosphate isomerase [Chloroflexota bacterium]